MNLLCPMATQQFHHYGLETSHKIKCCFLLMHAFNLIYIQHNSEKQNFRSQNTTKPVKPENSGIGVNQAAKAEWFTRHYIHLDIAAFCLSTVKMFSPRTTLAAGLVILVFSQLISSTAGNFIFSADFKTISKLYQFVVIVNYTSA